MVYVADTNNHTIRKITPAGAVTTLAGLAGASGSADGVGSAARFNSPEGVAVDAAGNVYVADTSSNTIRKITPAGAVTTLAGHGGCRPAPRTEWEVPRDSIGQLESPSTVPERVYVADQSTAEYGRLRRRARSRRWPDPPRVASTGWGLARDSIRLPALRSTARAWCTWLDQFNRSIRQVTPGGAVTTLAGLGNVARHRGRLWQPRPIHHPDQCGGRRQRHDLCDR